MTKTVIEAYIDKYKKLIILLSGFSGSGKTILGRSLSKDFKIDFINLITNPNAIHLFQDYLSDLDNFLWHSLNLNDNSVSILQKYPEQISWEFLSSNPNAIELLEQNFAVFVTEGNTKNIVFHQNTINIPITV